MRHPRVWLNASCTPGRIPEQPPPATKGRPGPGTVANAKAGKAARRVDWRVLPKFSACSARRIPSDSGNGKRDGPPQPDQNRGPAQRCLSLVVPANPSAVAPAKLSAVVPAQPGTHNPRTTLLSSVKANSESMGPRLRGDDN